MNSGNSNSLTSGGAINTETKNIIAHDPDIKIEINNGSVFSQYANFKGLATGTVGVDVGGVHPAIRTLRTILG